MSNNLERDTNSFQELIQQFLNEPESEVNKRRLQEILDEEINKPEDQIDLQLVDEILAVLEPTTAEREEIDASWDRLDRKIQDKQSEGKTIPARHRSVMVFLGRIAAVAAAIVVLFFITVGSAKAMKWTFLLKFLNPIAQTFGISLDEREPETDQTNISPMEDSILEQTQFSSEADVPVQYEGYKIRLSHVPERFTFVSGSVLNDELWVLYNMFYQSGETWLNYYVNIFPDDKTVLLLDYEKTADVLRTENVGMKELTFYHNSTDETISVSWVDRNAHYSLYGNLTEEELTEIIEGFNE